MKTTLRVSSIVFLLLVSLVSRAQDANLEGKLEEDMLHETTLVDEGSETLLLDNSRSKIGRDFYDSFFRHFATLPKALPPALNLTTLPIKADSTVKMQSSIDQDPNAFVVTIDELPAIGIGTALLSVTINDQIIWQNYVQLRQEVIDIYAQNAAETLQQYIVNYQDMQRQLDNEDLRGTGIF